MTLVALYETDGAIVLAGDALVTGDIPQAPFRIPGIRNVNATKRSKYVGKLVPKVVRVSDRLAVAWAGPVAVFCDVIKEVWRVHESGSRDGMIERVRDSILRYGNLQSGDSAFALLAWDEGSAKWLTETFGPWKTHADTGIATNIQATGSGRDLALAHIASEPTTSSAAEHVFNWTHRMLAQQGFEDQAIENLCGGAFQAVVASPGTPVLARVTAHVGVLCEARPGKNGSEDVRFVQITRTEYVGKTAQYTIAERDGLRMLALVCPTDFRPDSEIDAEVNGNLAPDFDLGVSMLGVYVTVIEPSPKGDLTLGVFCHPPSAPGQPFKLSGGPRNMPFKIEPTPDFRTSLAEPVAELRRLWLADFRKRGLI